MTGCFVTLTDHPDASVTAANVFHAAEERHPLWIDWNVPSDPFAVFMDNYYSTDVLLGEHSDPLGGGLFRRMLFVQQCAALEAYLGDTLVRAVLADDEAIQRLLAEDRQLTAARFTLAEIFASDDLVRDAVKRHLKGLLYHDLAKVDFLYRTALQIPVLSDKLENDALFRAIQLRHDCVHRNGFDIDGNRHEFTPTYVEETSQLFQRVAKRIELAVRSRNKADA